MTTFYRGQRVTAKADPRHVGRIVRIVPTLGKGHIARIQWEDRNWQSDYHVDELAVADDEKT